MAMNLVKVQLNIHSQSEEYIQEAGPPFDQMLGRSQSLLASQGIHR